MELADALRRAGGWRKSTRSTAQNTCVEVTAAVPGAVGVRDSKAAASAPFLAFDAGAWAALLVEVRR